MIDDNDEEESAGATLTVQGMRGGNVLKEATSTNTDPSSDE